MPEDKLIVWTRLIYEAKYIPPRMRTALTAILREDVPLNIPVVDPEDFPVAVRLRRQTHGKWVETELYTHRGFLWRPLRLNDGTPVQAKRFLDLARGQGSWRDNPFIKEDFRYLPKNRPEERGEIEARIWESDERDECIARAQRLAASGVVLCGGVAYRKTLEPVWRVEVRDGRANVSWIPGSEETPETAVRCFRIDRLDDAVSFGQAAAGDASDPSVDGEADILIPEILVRNDLVRAAQGFVPDAFGAAKLCLHELSREAMTAFCDLRDVTGVSGNARLADEASARRAFEALCRLAAALEADRPNETAGKIARYMRLARLRYEGFERHELSADDVALLEDMHEGSLKP